MQILQWQLNIGNMLKSMTKTTPKGSFIISSELYAAGMQIYLLVVGSACTLITFDKIIGRKDPRFIKVNNENQQLLFTDYLKN